MCSPVFTYTDNNLLCLLLCLLGLHELIFCEYSKCLLLFRV